MARFLPVEDYPAKLTCRSKISLIGQIRSKLENSPKEALFRASCLGWLWDLDFTSDENCVLIHYLGCCQVYSEEEDNINDRFTYYVNGREIYFGREEFCLVTSLKFGVEFKDAFTSGPMPFRRRVFGSRYDGRLITAGQLQEKILSDSFYDLNNDDAVGVCLLACMELILLGHEISHTVPEWYFRIVDNREAWNMYPWGSYVWPTLYWQLRNAVGWRVHHFINDLPEGKVHSYTLIGFTWAFKTWILETYRANSVALYTYVHSHPRVTRWRRLRRFYRRHLPLLIEGVVPVNLTPDPEESHAHWWIDSKRYFDGEIHDHPPIPVRANPYIREEVPHDVYHLLSEHSNQIKDVYNLIKELRDMRRPETCAAPVNHGVSSLLSGVPRTQDFLGRSKNVADPPSSNFFDGAWPSPHTPVYPQSVRNSTQIPTYGQVSDMRNMSPAPTPQSNMGPPRGFDAYNRQSVSRMGECGPSNTPAENPVLFDGMNREKRERRPGRQQQSPYVPLPPSTILVPKRVRKTKAKQHAQNISSLDLNFNVPESVKFDNVDVAKVRRETYEDLTTFLRRPYSIYLDCHMRGYVVEPEFWLSLIPDGIGELSVNSYIPWEKRGWLSDDQMNAWLELLIRTRPPHSPWTVAKAKTTTLDTLANMFSLDLDFFIRGTINGTSPPYPSWDIVEWVFLPIMHGDHWVTGVINLNRSSFTIYDSNYFPDRGQMICESLVCWTESLNRFLLNDGHFDRTKRQPYQFSFHYNPTDIMVPQQQNSYDCGVITCWLIEQLIQGGTPQYISQPNAFFGQFRLEMARRFYAHRCEETDDCGYDDV